MVNLKTPREAILAEKTHATLVFLHFRSFEGIHGRQEKEKKALIEKGYFSPCLPLELHKVLYSRMRPFWALCLPPSLSAKAVTTYRVRRGQERGNYYGTKAAARTDFGGRGRVVELGGHFLTARFPGAVRAPSLSPSPPLSVRMPHKSP